MRTLLGLTGVPSPNLAEDNDSSSDNLREFFLGCGIGMCFMLRLNTSAASTAASGFYIIFGCARFGDNDGLLTSESSLLLSLFIRPLETRWSDES